MKEWTPAASVRELVDSPYRTPGSVRRSSAEPVASELERWQYAHWLLRAAGALIDGALFWSILVAGFIPIKVLGLVDERGDPAGLGMALWIFAVLTALAAGFWNKVVADGRTGRSLGRLVTGTRLVSLRTGQPLGIAMGFARSLCHLLDRLSCCLGFLWPLWDERRQTFADKVIGSVVILERR